MKIRDLTRNYRQEIVKIGDVTLRDPFVTLRDPFAKSTLLFAAQRGHLKPPGEWNEQEIALNGRHVTVKLNGATIVDANLDDIKDPAKLAKHPGIKNESGHIGFLGHNTEVEFRNIRIKEL